MCLIKSTSFTFILQLVGLPGLAQDNCSIFVPNSAFYFSHHGNSQSFESLTSIKPQNAPWCPHSKTPQIPPIHPVVSGRVGWSIGLATGWSWVRILLRQLHFGTLAVPFTPHCQCLSEETLKAVGPFYIYLYI